MSSLNYFNSIAKDWNKIRVSYFKDELRELAINSVNIKNKTILDLGSGTGFISLRVAKESNIVFPLDASTNMLKELYASAKKENLTNIYPIKGVAEDLPIFDESIDIIFMNMALHHVANPDKAIKEMFRVLKIGGNVVITDVEEHSGEWAKEEMFDLWLGFSHKQLTIWYEGAGFKNLDIRSTGLKCQGSSSKGEFVNPDIFIAIGEK
ncbi:class I SAM-dependent methyltransferase [Clostridium gasigenes]|uniref:Methyltransferase domain-containing protein n=1 Tax=Clostridium gasigenes TaxID=94869 RepID=A0A1H0VYF8_9CLOT|nr:class I SAM-dependent methyltransferase [Clostridium gasigenes]MBU3090226.1 class I SAM-dependent methyltransferase [Clostridium gasigenes]SDP83278.1 Methyltransferase domain-containing protein [Clostridium gasigenes]